MESKDSVEAQAEITRAIAALQLAREILSGLTQSNHSPSPGALLQRRAAALDVWLTGAEINVLTKFLEGMSPEMIAYERSLSTRTVANQIRSGCRKLGFTHRQELKGWWTGARGYILTRPPEDAET